jgi:hypothetical protein
LFESSRDRLPDIPDDETLAKFPFVHNAYIAGYMGYLELEKLAGFTEEPEVRKQLDRLLELRATTFTTASPYGVLSPFAGEGCCRALTVSRNFIFLVPELAEYLHQAAFWKVKDAVDEYERVAPYWFVSFSETGIGESSLSPLYDRTLLLAKAWILKEPINSVLPYLDVPAFPVGDLIYIQNLVATLELSATDSGEESPGSRRNQSASKEP